MTRKVPLIISLVLLALVGYWAWLKFAPIVVTEEPVTTETVVAKELEFRREAEDSPDVVRTLALIFPDGTVTEVVPKDEPFDQVVIVDSPQEPKPMYRVQYRYFALKRTIIGSWGHTVGDKVVVLVPRLNSSVQPFEYLPPTGRGL
jgi:hypothetical protein